MHRAYVQLRIGGISGCFYPSYHNSSTILVYGIGAPAIPDSGALKEADSVIRKGIDLFVPDYIGYGRSTGFFRPINCVETFLRLRRSFMGGCSAVNNFRGLRLRLRYDRILFAGKSFGGRYISLLPKFEPDVSDLALICPALETGSYGNAYIEEESIKDFLRCMGKDGYSNLYRGFFHKGRISREWRIHLSDKDDMAPLSNVQSMGDARIFIAHGRHDKSINFHRSVSYYRMLRSAFPNKKRESLTLRLYNEDHGGGLAKKALGAFVRWALGR